MEIVWETPDAKSLEFCSQRFSGIWLVRWNKSGESPQYFWSNSFGFDRTISGLGVVICYQFYRQIVAHVDGFFAGIGDSIQR